MKDRLIVALDVPSQAEARAVVERLPEATWFKVGLQAFLGFGPELIEWLHGQKRRLFLDLKFKDIPNTVAGAVQSALTFAPGLLTIHCSGGAAMVRAAVEAAAPRPETTVLGVTVLTSMGPADLAQTGMAGTPEEAVLRLVELGLASGLRAFVCSPREIEPIRRRFGADVQLVAPGIRPLWAESGDQKRVFTPAQAMAAGADLLVVGRPLTHAPDPAAAFARLLSEMADGAAAKGR